MSDTEPAATGASEPRLDREASIGALRELFHDGLISRDALEAAGARMGASLRWRFWIDRVLLVLGTALVLAGLISFLALHWHDLGRTIKLGGPAVLVVAAVLTALWVGLDRPVGRALLFAGSVFVGLFLGAFGQVYQTGADAWELFRAWWLLITFWVVASRHHEQWLLWIALVDVMIAMWYEQAARPPWIYTVWPWVVTALLQVAALVGLHFGNAKRYFVIPHVWPRWLLVPATLFLFVGPLSVQVVDKGLVGVDVWVLFLAYIGFLVAGFWYFRFHARDLFSLTCLGFSVVWLATCFVFRVARVFELRDVSMLLFVGLIVAAMLTGLVAWVRRIQKQMGNEA
ncbi:MAG: DUF2157 domain-containing protein [Planctomycetes bacterium]|nr:DUF2157 domain-containing protein [Planctomycetota bacterium]